MHCRQTKLTGKGVKQFLDWLSLDKKDFTERNNIQLLAYMLRFIIQLIVGSAIRVSNNMAGLGRVLHDTKRALSREAYE